MKNVWLRFGRAFLFAGLFTGVLDAVFLILSNKMFFDMQEAARAVLLTLGIDAGIGLVFGIAAFFIYAAGRGVFAKLAWREHSVRKAFAAAAVLTGPFIFVLLRLSSGPQASLLPGRIPVASLIGAVCALAAGFALMLLPLWAAVSNRRKRILLLTSLLAAVVLTVADAIVLVRLYPIFHGGLTACALLVSGFGIVFGTTPPSGSKAFKLYQAVLIFALGLGGFSVVRIFHTQNIRFVVSQSAPAASDALALMQGMMTGGAADNLGDIPDIDGPLTAQNALSLPGADVFLITVDAMRYDRLKMLGAERSVAPNIDRFAESAVVFERAYTAIPHTSYALTSLMTGKYTRPLFDVPGAPPVHETWPQVMKRFRYDTAAFFPPAIFFIDRARFEPYFREGLGFSYRKVEAKHTAQERTDTLTAYLEEKKQRKRPLFSWIHYFEPHEPYEPSCTRFGASPEDRYDCEIWTVDKAVGGLLRYIETSRPGAVVIISADHGEEFGDHGGAYHGTTLFDEQARVPLLMKIPGVSPRRVKAPVSLVDLMGTVLRIVDIPKPARVRSRDLTGVIMDGDTNIDVFAEVHDDAMVVFDDHKLICDVKSDLCRLYDLKRDPKETRSLAEKETERTAAMKKRLFAWRQSHARYELRPVSEDENGEKWPAAIKRALGGDMNATDDLLAVLSTSKEVAIRRKAAQLVFRLSEKMPRNLPLNPDEPDAETAAWLNALLAKFGDKDAAAYLAKAARNLDPKCAAFRAVALVRAAVGDTAVYDDLLGLALDDTAPVEDRRQALGYLASMEKRPGAEKLLVLIDNYQLTLDAAKTLGALKLKAAVPSLCKRLKRERFLERKAAIIEALSFIGDWRAAAPIMDELYNETPPPGALLALSRIVELSPFGRRLSSEQKEHVTVFYNPAPKEPARVYLKKIDRAVLRTTASADGGTVVVSCGGETMGRAPLTAGSGESFVDLSSCKKDRGKPYVLTFQIDAELNQASVDMTAVLGK